jgi:flagellar protein FliS
MNQHVKFGHAANAYRSAAIATSPLNAIVMLYDAAISGLSRTTVALEQKRFDEAFSHLDRAMAILRGLCHSLDFEKGGAFAERMRDTYLALIMSGLHAFGKPDAQERFGKLIAALVGLRDAWIEVRAGLARPQAGRSSTMS